MTDRVFAILQAALQWLGAYVFFRAGQDARELSQTRKMLDDVEKANAVAADIRRLPAGGAAERLRRWRRR
ncbi:MAG: hypothetical protein AB7G06_05645 [Bdellovibrionales bacterium]